jgi:hypothetical protein
MNESYVGPIQPFTGGMSQENFGQMIDHVLSWNPRIPSQLVKRRINVHLRDIQDLRIWGGLMVRGEFHCPAAYITGTIAATPGSDIITGTGTLWPYNDTVNTTLGATAITVINEIQDITPTSIVGIEMGDWLLVDEGLATEEWLLVHSVTGSTFQAKPTQLHAANTATITKSSFSQLQIRVGYNKNYYTIIGIKSDQTMKLDHSWSYAIETAQSYQIVRAYITFPPGLKIVWSIVNIQQGWAIKPYIPQEVVQRFDAWRSAKSWPSILVNFMPDHIGRIRYELYPTPTVEQGIPYLAARVIAPLSADEDCCPTCIPSHIVVNHALADALLHDRKSEYYDPLASKEFRRQAQDSMNGAVLADDNIYMQNLEWIISRYNLVAPGADFWQSHDEGYFG